MDSEDRTRARPPAPIPRRLEVLGWVLDDALRIPGTDRRVGVDPILGLLPGAGDYAGSVLSAWVVLEAAVLGAPASVLLRMLGNVGLELVVGVVPLLGDLFDFGWKANRRNLALLRAWMGAPDRVARRSRLGVAAVALALAGMIGAAGYASFLVLQALWRLVT